jgi:hypothetical protein
MRTTNELLNAVRARHGLTSDYQLAKFLKVTSSRLANYRKHRSRLDDALCIQVADALHLDRGRVLAIVAAERAQSEQAKREWLKLAAAVAGVAVLLVAPDQLAAVLDGAHWPTLYIM